MTGLELLEKVRASEKYKHLPFVLLTAESDQSQKAEADAKGVDNYIVKPFSAADLKDKLQETYQLKNKKAA